jgi:hypothetical protein
VHVLNDLGHRRGGSEEQSQRNEGGLEALDGKIVLAAIFARSQLKLHFRRIPVLINEIAIGKKAALGDGW